MARVQYFPMKVLVIHSFIKYTSSKEIDRALTAATTSQILEVPTAEDLPKKCATILGFRWIGLLGF
jgi:hypothetical protein